MGRCEGPQMIVTGWFSSLSPTPTPAPYILYREVYSQYFQEYRTNQPLSFSESFSGKNLPKCESLASVLAYVLWLPPCRYWITEFWIMFKMDTSLASTMEEFQELVKANGEELHRRLIDTTQMWVPCLWKPPPSCNTTQAAQQASVSCCDLCCVPLRPKKPSGRFSGFTKENCLVPGKQRSPWW